MFRGVLVKSLAKIQLRNRVTKYKSYEIIFFATSILLSILVFFDQLFWEYVFKIITMSSLALLYFVTSKRKDKWYFLALFFATISNLLFISNEMTSLTFGMFAYLVYRLLTIIIVVKATVKCYLISITIGTILFLTPLIYFILLNEDSFGQSLVPAIINVSLISVLGGLSISNYLMEEGVKNTWLLISSIAFAFLAVIFVIQKYYLFVPILDSLRVIVLMGAHYIFYRYKLLSES